MNIWKFTVLDDFIPCSPFGKPLFGHYLEGWDWVCLLEKHFAKKYQNYWNLRTGSCRSALVDLSGCPVQSFNLSNSADSKLITFEIIKSNLEKGNVVTCGSRKLEDEAITSNHAYVILKTFLKSESGFLGKE